MSDPHIQRLDLFFYVDLIFDVGSTQILLDLLNKLEYHSNDVMFSHDWTKLVKMDPTLASFLMANPKWEPFQTG